MGDEADRFLDQILDGPGYKQPRRINNGPCKCGRGYKSAYDGLCGHCRTRKQKEVHQKLLNQGKPTEMPKRILRYAGIGSRKTPEYIQKMMQSIAQQLGQSGWVLRSGFADGADISFGWGAETVDGAMELFVPWTGYNGAPWNDPRVIVPPMTQELMDLAMKFHPAWHNCSQGAQKLHARNGSIILGLDLKTPVDCVICWTPNGLRGGGTGQALRIADAYEIPIFDLALPDDLPRLCKFTEQAERVEEPIHA